ncbi:unnamed protein product [Umbelopsis ramanniana]
MVDNERVRFPKLKPAEPQGTHLLAVERQNASFKPEELSVYMHGQQYLDARESILKILQNDPILGDKSKRYYQGRDQRFDGAMLNAKRFAELIREHKWNADEVLIADMMIDEPNQFRLHCSMFMPTIANQGTEEQKDFFLRPAENYQIIGCYAQTELGHGSNVQGLETTATYDPSTQSFILHSPTLTAAKWWIGGLGKAGTHACVMARLITQGKDHGPHPFIVQIRSLEDHRPRNGVTVGDIGPKFGFNTVDNGFVLFDNYKIPHISMLAKYSQVVKATGEYVKPPNAKLSYGTMVFVRANIVMESRYVLARAATIAVRYAAIRSQFVDAANPKKLEGTTRVVETPVIDYNMVQYRLFPVIAQAYACFFTGKEMYRMYNENQDRMAQGDYSFLADLHATSSGLKSLTTTISLAAIEQCRRACGGHGYSMFSGFGNFYQDYLPKVTWEGDNYILTQQTARYLGKTFRSVAASKGDEQHNTFSARYIQDYLSNSNARCPAQSAEDFLNPEIILSAYRYRVAQMIETFVRKTDQENRTFNSMLVLVYQISRAHCQLFIVSNFMAAVFPGPTQKELSKEVLGVLRTMALLYALYTMEEELADFLCSQYLSSEQATMIKEQVVRLLGKVRPDAVALVDAFGLPDYQLNSALGNSKGEVYEQMTAMAEMEPLNHRAVHESYEEIIKPFVHAGKHLWKRDNNGIARL